MLARTRKRLVVEGQILEAGEIVDISGWRNAKTLVSGRYVDLVQETEAPKVKKADEPKKVDEPKEESKAVKTKTKK